MLDHTKPYLEKIHCVDAEPARHVDKVDMKLQRLCGIGFCLFAVLMLAKQCHFGVT